jgi:hypothetical protein
VSANVGLGHAERGCGHRRDLAHAQPAVEHDPCDLRAGQHAGEIAFRAFELGDPLLQLSDERRVERVPLPVWSLRPAPALFRHPPTLPDAILLQLPPGPAVT